MALTVAKKPVWPDFFLFFLLLLGTGCGAVGAPLPAGSLEQRANAGDVAAQNTLALCLLKGGCAEGIGQDVRRAAYYFKSAAGQGNAQAQSNLAELYYRGKGGLPLDRFRAFDYFLLAARQNYAWAQYRAGDMLVRAEGVASPDMVEGYFWLKVAAGRRSPVQRAKSRLEDVAPLLDGREREEADLRAGRWLLTAEDTSR